MSPVAFAVSFNVFPQTPYATNAAAGVPVGKFVELFNYDLEVPARARIRFVVMAMWILVKSVMMATPSTPILVPISVRQTPAHPLPSRLPNASLRDFLQCSLHREVLNAKCGVVREMLLAWDATL